MGSPAPDPRDRRVQRTRRTLRQALIALMMEKGWDAVTVQDVCERADVGRSTFYTHFADKEELLVGGFDDLRKMMRAQLAATSRHGHELRFVHGMIEHANEHQRLFRALVGRHTGQVVLQRFRDLVIDLVREDLAALRGVGAANEPAVHFIAGAFLELLSWSIEPRSPVRVLDVERLFQDMVAPALQAISGGVVQG